MSKFSTLRRMADLLPVVEGTTRAVRALAHLKAFHAEYVLSFVILAVLFANSDSSFSLLDPWLNVSGTTQALALCDKQLDSIGVRQLWYPRAAEEDEPAPADYLGGARTSRRQTKKCCQII